MSYLRRRKNAFYFAIQGLSSSIDREAHMKIHLIAAFFVVAAGGYFSVDRFEWCILVFAIVLVVVSELFNTAIEKACDVMMPEPHPVIKYIKDISSAAVLLSCIAAIIAGGIVFWPYIKGLF